jgi:hypothetical protein
MREVEFDRLSERMGRFQEIVDSARASGVPGSVMRGGRQVGLGIALACLFLQLLPPQAAWAAPCTNAGRKHVLESPASNGRGNRSSNMDTFNTGIVCARVSSIADFSTTSPAFVEAGWLENPHDYLFHCQTTDTKPRIFTTFVRTNNTGNCETGQEINDGTRHYYIVRDNALDGNWVLVIDGSNSAKQTPDLGAFTTGQPDANAERYVSGDENHVYIPNLQRMNVNADWVDWDAPFRHVEDNDPNWGSCNSDLQNLIMNVTQACQ